MSNDYSINQAKKITHDAGVAFANMIIAFELLSDCLIKSSNDINEAFSKIKIPKELVDRIEELGHDIDD